MSNVLVNKDKLDVLANAIANKSGESLTLTLDEMVDAVDGIDTSGGTPTLETITKTYTATTSQQTDTITPSSGYDGIEEVDVTVSAIPIATIGDDGYNSEFYTSNNARKWRTRFWREFNSGGYLGAYTSGQAENEDWLTKDAIASGTSVTPTESAQTIGGSNTMLEGAVTVNAIQSSYVGSGITRRDSTDLTASGATVTAPSGYYASSATKTISSGSATPASSISATGATVSTGTNTLTLSKSVSNTPQVSAGYISSGTAGNSSVSLTASVTTKGATNHYATTSDQTIASGTYLTGTQTIKALSQTNLTADNIKNGTTITINNGNANVWSVTGTYTGGGGGTDRLVLLQTTSIGSLSTSSTSGTDTGKTVSLAQSTGWQNYDLLLVDISVDTTTNGRHTSTVTPVILTGTSNVSTKNTYTVGSNKWNSKLGSTGTASTRQSTTAYGVYINSASVSSNTLTLTVYYKYNSNNTGTLNGTYTARVYGVKLIDLIGG